MRELVYIDDACREILNYIQSDTFNQSFSEEDRSAVMSGLSLAGIIIMAECDKYLMQDGVLKDKEKDDADKTTNWIGVKDKLPDRSGKYQVCITVPLDPNDGELYCDPETGKPWDLNYVDALFFNKEQGGVWEDENGCYGADLDKIRTDKVAHVSHWAPLPELPKELRSKR